MKLPPESARLLEDAADEVARLDLACSTSPPAVGIACWLRALGAFAPRQPSSLGALVASLADPIHDPQLGRHLPGIRAFLASEERRVRGGAPLSLSRWEVVAPGLATYPLRPSVEATLREDVRTAPALERAIAFAAWLDDPSIAADGNDLGSLAISLTLCATGRLMRARFAPLTSCPRDERARASAEWRQGTAEPWTALALESTAREARRTRRALDALPGLVERDDAALAGMGRAAISARRALADLRSRLATTAPLLAEELALSRPAATDALERLADAGVAREVTGRARDRVFAWTAPLVALEGRPGE